MVTKNLVNVVAPEPTKELQPNLTQILAVVGP